MFGAQFQHEKDLGTSGGQVSYRILILVGVVAALVGLLFMLPNKPMTTDNSAWVVHAEAPEVIGGYGDNFCYDGEGGQTLSGTLNLIIARDGSGSIDGTVSTTEGSKPLHPTSSDELTGTIRIVSHIDASSDVSTDIDINGDTSRGDPSLPQTHALLDGKSTFDVYVNGPLLYEKLRGEWSLADAVRQSDGSIRQSGLLYSPLLRDKSGFSDPKRTEFTLLLHSEKSDANNKPPYSIALHLVFSDVTVEKQPPAVGQ